MIVSFSVSNFRSFSAEQTFSLVASKRLSNSHEQHAVPIPDSDERVLRCGVIYGANGAGKSNLFKALAYVSSVAVRPGRSEGGTGRDAFRFGGNPAEPSTFDLQFIAEGKLFRFGFEIDDLQIMREWLARVRGSRETIVYERVTRDTGEVVVEGPGLKGARAGKKLQALAIIGSLPNQSFLAAIQANLVPADQTQDLVDVLNWFSISLKMISPEAKHPFLAYQLTRSSDLRDLAGEFLQTVGTGIDHLDVVQTEIMEDELRAILPEGVLSRAWEPKSNGGNHALIQDEDGNELVIERKAGNRSYRVKLQAAHKQQTGEMVPMEIGQESDGTRRLLQLIPALHHVRQTNAVYFIDEIDRSLHPILVRTFLESFLKSCESGYRQIIVTTHESSLLDQDLLRRDEIWFAEKDHSAATRLYSLVDFNVRKDLEIRKHYLQGRFGAIPFIGSLENLLKEKGQPR